MRKSTILLFSGLALLLLSGCTTEPVGKGQDEPELRYDKTQAALEKAKAGETPQASEAPQGKTPTPAANTSSNGKNAMYHEAPHMTIDQKKTYEATLHTSEGDIVVSLAAKETPVTVNNFVFLARDHFYDGTIFHRVIKGFMIQGGDPSGDGTGGPGYTFPDEPFTGEYTRGTLAMANAGPDTNGSQFFIVHEDTPLPKNYVIFGHVTAGLDVVDKIAEAPVEASASGEASRPVSPVRVTSVDISEK
jgi:cyclophilin family peptidyl-prolyl cis-trans isomerase